MFIQLTLSIIIVEPFSLIHWEVDSKNIFIGNNDQVSETGPFYVISTSWLNIPCLYIKWYKW